MLVLSSPSGAGKTSICKKVISLDKKFRYLYHTLPDREERVKKMAKIMFLFQRKNLRI